MNEPTLIIRICGTMAQVLEALKSLAEYSGGRSLGFFVRRLERR